MDSTRITHGLRIAWSAWWGTLAALSLILWVRGYWAADSMSIDASGKDYTVQSVRGMIVMKYYNPAKRFRRQSKQSPPTRVRVRSTPLGDDYNHILQEHPSILGFKYSDSKAQYFVVPYWFPSFAAAALAALPWVKLSRKFSLRTMFIATTLVAVVLGLGAWLSR